MAWLMMSMIFALVSSVHVVNAQRIEGWINGHQANELIQNLTQASLGSNRLQKEFDNYQYNEESLNGQMLLKESEASIGRKFAETFKTVSDLAESIAAAYENDTFVKNIDRQDNRQCCKTDESSMEDSLDFKTKVDLKSACLRFSSDAELGAKVPYSDKLVRKMQANRFDRRFLKWQYFGSAEGVMIQYPNNKDKSRCGVYDPRFRPWFVQSATSFPKDIILVIDKSSSMGTDGRLSLVKEASGVVIDTLNADDRLAVIAFSDNGQFLMPPGEHDRTCYNRELAFGTPENKEYLSKWIRELESEGGSNYKNPLERAFEVFEVSGTVEDDPRPRRRFILFMTDGGPDDTTVNDINDNNILNLIRERNAKLNNSVIIFTYGIGKDIDRANTPLLDAMAQQNTANPSAGPITAGTYTIIGDKTNLKSKIGNYYSSTINYTSDMPVISTPYFDFSGLGLVVSVCRGVHLSSSRFIGVTCADISLNEILAEVLYLHHGVNSYAFIVDYKGRTVLHPQLPDAHSYGQTVYVNIKDLENDIGVESVLTSMIKGESGEQPLNRKFIKARGNTTTDGISVKTLQAHYFWKKIAMTNLTLGIVTTSNDKNISVKARNLFTKAFVYHRLDLVQEDVKMCKYNGRLSTTAHSVVKLTEIAFHNPIDYVNREDNKNIVETYKAYLCETQEHPNKILKSVAKQMLGISESVEKIWRIRTQYDQYVAWRYYADYFGSIRVYPGLSLAKAYDHTKRAWFVKAVANPTLTTLTTPYLDAFGAGIVFTLSVPIRVGRGSQEHLQTDPIIGVAAMDFKFSYMKFLVETQYKACTRPDHVCFIVDSSGFLVYHEDIKYDSEDSKEVEGFHLTELEPDIATYLMDKNNGNGKPWLRREPCKEFGSKRKLYTWRLELSFNVENYERTPSFELQKVPDTNIFLGIRRKQTQANKCGCPDRKSDTYSSTYQCTKESECQCPCYVSAGYQYCENVFKERSEGDNACVPQPPSIGYQNTDPPDLLNTLKDCYENKCDEMLRKSSCESTVGCVWCEGAQNGKCRQWECPAGVHSTPTTPGQNATADTQRLIYIGAGAGVGVVAIVVIIVAVLAAKKKTCCQNPGREPRPGRYQPESESVYEEPIAGRLNKPRLDIVYDEAVRYVHHDPVAVGHATDDQYIHTEESPPHYEDFKGQSNKAFF